MLTKIKTATISGIEGRPVTVETDLHRGLPSLTVVGLADTTIKESCDRVRPAIMNSGYDFPNGRVTVNLMPAGSRKEGSHFDLPIAVGIILLGRETEEPKDIAFLGEVSLDGKINRVRGALPLAMCLRNAGIGNIVVPPGNASETAMLEDVNILPAADLRQAVEHVLGVNKIEPYREQIRTERRSDELDFSQVIGQETAKRAVTIAAAGNHGILMMGGPGCGKTMISKRIPTILPPLTYEEKLEITGIYSVAGLLDEKHPVIEDRPFRGPHHTVTLAALIGGGRVPKPGEISLAHRGVLFLDELGEFDSRIIDAMRQPIEDGYIRLNRNADEVTFPARVMIAVAANPCKCGNLWSENRVCTCTARQIASHMRKLSGPFSDRIDIHLKMMPVSGEDIEGCGAAAGTETSAQMREKVEKAISAQRERYAGTPYDSNGYLDEKGIDIFCKLDRGCGRMLSAAYDRLGLTMRAYNKVLKVARTIADIEGEERVKEEHIAEALMYRVSDGAAGGNNLI